jgi:FAD/FMN-containing dehydrogenase
MISNGNPDRLRPSNAHTEHRLMRVAPSFQSQAIAALKGVLPQGGLLTTEEDVARYSRDWSGDHYGRPLAVARPRNVLEAAAVMRKCTELSIPVVPQGGLTGLVGAAVAAPGGGELVISLERLNAVRFVDAIDFAMVVEAGCILEDAKRAAEAKDCLLPITFGAQGTCRIGGNIATNAGGMNVLRYGMTRDLVLGLEVVLADGRVWNGLNVLRKDNRGYDLKQLFIGSEGTLGIITAAALKLFPKPDRVETALIGLRSVEDAMALYARARRACGDLLTAFELILRDGLEVALKARTDLVDPLQRPHPVYVLMEAATSAKIELRDLFESFLAEASDLVDDGVIAASRAQSDRLWLFRETMVEAQGRGGRYLRTDVSVPISALAVFVGEALRALRARYPEALALAYGHVGDGNVHLNVIPPEGATPEAMSHLFEGAEEIIFAVVDRLHGSISAEHGIGRVKRRAFLDRVDAVALDLATRLKSTIDPRGLLSAGRILPAPGGSER